jgi:hypothetical protein
LVSCHVYVLENLAEQAGTDDFAGMYWYDRHTSVRMAQKVMTTPAPNDQETGALKRGYNFTATKAGKSRHASDGQSLNADELVFRRARAIDLETQSDGLTRALEEFVQ